MATCFECASNYTKTKTPKKNLILNAYETAKNYKHFKSRSLFVRHNYLQYIIEVRSVFTFLHVRANLKITETLHTPVSKFEFILAMHLI
jgi:hypothetical protein